MIKKYKKVMYGCVIFIFMLMQSMVFMPNGFTESLGNIEIDMLTVNDFHGALSGNPKYPGAARMVAVLKGEKEKNPGGTLIVSAGDMFQGSVESNLVYGKTVVDVMNEAGFDAMALGNHEFDWGLERLTGLIQQSRFPYMAANVYHSKTGEPVALTVPYVVVERQGIKIALIGITTPETAVKTNPRVVGSYQFSDPADTVNRLVPELKKQGADMIVVVSHLGCEYGEDKKTIVGEAADLARAIVGVDAIITGHSHQVIQGTVNGIPLVQAGYSGRAVGKIQLIYSPSQHKIISHMVQVIEVPLLSGGEDAEVDKIVANAKAAVQPLLENVLGTSVQEIPHDRQQLSLLGQWTTDVMREATGAEIAFQNGGGLRTGIHAGNLTMGNVYEVLPFDNTIVTMRLSGAQITEVLEYGIDNKKMGSLQFSGMKVAYDSLQKPGKRVQAVFLLDGRRLDPTAMYTVAVNDFMAVGGDGFRTFLSGQDVNDTYMLLRDTIVNAIRETQIINYQEDDRLDRIHSMQAFKLPEAA